MSKRRFTRVDIQCVSTYSAGTDNFHADIFELGFNCEFDLRFRGPKLNVKLIVRLEVELSGAARGAA